MRKLITVITLAATIGAGTLAASLPASAAVNWRQRTCQAATAYQHHPSAGSLATLVTASTHLPRGYLKADVGQLYADASSPSKNAWKYLTVSEQYASEDCYGGA